MSGSQDIQTEFIARIKNHQGILHKIGFVYAADDVSREDLYQEMVLQLWKSYPSFKGKSAFSTWMYRVALNTAITLTRKRRIFGGDLMEKHSVFDADQSMNQSEDLKILYQAISTLNNVEKAIIMMWMDDKSYLEIAETFGISVQNVSVKLVRIKKKLGEKIKSLQ